MEQIIISNKRFVSSDNEFDHYIVDIDGTDVRAHQKKDGSGFGFSMKDLCKAFNYSTIDELKASEAWKQLNEQLGNTVTTSTLKAHYSGESSNTVNISTGYSSPAFYAGGTLDQASNLAENPYREDDVCNFLVTHAGLLVANQALIRGKVESNKSGSRIVIDPEERALKLMNGDTVFSKWYFDVESDFSALTFKRNNDQVVITPNYLRSSTQDRSASVWADKNFGIRYSVEPFIINNPDTAHFEVRAETDDSLILIARKLPTSSDGLLHGQVWNDNGTLKVKS